MNMGILILLSMIYADSNGLNMIITNSLPDLIHLDKDAVYNLKTDGRGAVTIKSKKSGERSWSKPQTVHVDGCAGNLLENGAKVIDTKEGYMLGYSPTEEDFMKSNEYPVYTTDEYNQMVNNPESINTLYKGDPKFIEGYQNGNNDSVFYQYKPTEREKKMADMKNSKDGNEKDKDKDKDKDGKKKDKDKAKDSEEEDGSSEKNNKTDSKEDDSEDNGAISITTLTIIISTILSVGATAYI